MASSALGAVCAGLNSFSCCFPFAAIRQLNAYSARRNPPGIPTPLLPRPFSLFCNLLTALGVSSTSKLTPTDGPEMVPDWDSVPSTTHPLTHQTINHMQRNLSSVLKMAACLGLMTSLSAFAADVSGTYSWTQAGRNGGPDRKTTLVLKADGEKLTGTLTAPAGGRRGNANADAAAPAPAA